MIPGLPSVLFDSDGRKGEQIYDQGVLGEIRNAEKVHVKQDGSGLTASVSKQQSAA